MKDSPDQRDMMEEETKDVHIVSVEVKNIHRLTMAQLEIEPGGGLVRVVGKNRAGKSSVLRSLRMALGGGKQILPDAVNKSAKSKTGDIVLKLTNGLTVERHVKADGRSTLKVKSKDGGKYAQTHLNELLGEHHDFDILNIFSLKEPRLLEILFGLSKNKGLAEAVRKLRDEEKADYDRRTPFLSEQTRCRKISEPFGERPEPVDTSAAIAELAALNAIEKRMVRAHDHVVSEEKKLEQTKREVAELRESLSNAEHSLTLQHDRVESLQKEYDDISDPAEEIVALTNRIDSASQINEWMKPWNEFDRAQESLSEATESADALKVKIEDARAAIRELIASADIPVDGLTFDPETGSPLLGGMSFKSASGEERITMALDVAVAADPDLKIVLIDEANDLDLDSLRTLDEQAKERRFQVWCCRVDEQGGGEIIVEDGKARTG